MPALKRTLSDFDKGSPPSKRTKKLSNDEKGKENWGIIESISLRNFMCHSRLSIKFSRRINFIVGNNGSGKSALLTGLVVGLGGNASSTGRGTALKTLIKTGSSSACIEVTLRNNGNEPVKPEVYGDKIIVERRLFMDGSTAYKIKTSERKVVSSRKEDLSNILDELNLQVDNPLTSLNQEMSKNFLNSKSESDKYKLFLKATQLEQMNKDYCFIQDQKKLVAKIHEGNQRNLHDLENEVLDKEQQFKNISTIQGLKRNIETLKCELAWSHIAQLEQRLKPVKKQLEREFARSNMFDAGLKKCADMESKWQKHCDELHIKVETYKQQIELLEPKKKRAAFEDANHRFKANQKELERAKRQLQEVKKDKEMMNDRIKELKTSSSEDLKEKMEKRENQLGYLRDQLEELDVQLKSLYDHSDQFYSAVQTGLQKISNYSQEEKALYQEKSKVDKILTKLNSDTPSNKSKLLLFGFKMPEFVSRIEQAYAQKQFRKMPRGPIGSCITLKDKTCAVAVEHALRSVIHCFVVDSYHDEKILEQLRNTVFYDYDCSLVKIYTMKFSEHMYDVSNHKVIHPVYFSVLDLLKIDDVVIHNFLVDVSEIETVLIIPETKDALQTMQESIPPKNCTKAYTKIGDEVLQDAYYSNHANPVSRFLDVDVQDKITLHQTKLHSISQQLQDLSQVKKKLQLNIVKQQELLGQYECRKNCIKGQIKSIQVEIKEIEYVDDPDLFDTKSVEDELLAYNQQIASTEVVIENLTQQHQVLMDIRNKTKQNYEEMNRETKMIADNRETLIEEMHHASAKLEKAQLDRARYMDGKKKHEETIQKLEKEIAAKNAQIEKEGKKAALIYQEKIVTSRSPRSIEEEILRLDILISKEEEQHGEHERIVTEYHETKERFFQLNKRIRWSKKFLQAIDTYLEERRVAFNRIRTILSLRCAINFNRLLSQRGFFGNIRFKHDEKKLSLIIQPQDISSHPDDVRALSGGERSFSTVCFITALWNVIESPLLFLDEFDVFMDMANRRVAMDLMIEIALQHKQKLFVFLTPHEISALPKSSCLRVWKMPNPDSSQTVLPF